MDVADVGELGDGLAVVDLVFFGRVEEERGREKVSEFFCSSVLFAGKENSLIIISLSLSHLRSPDVALHLELAPQPVDDDVQVELAHALNDRLVGLLVAGVVERGVFLGELVQPDAHLLEVALRLGLDRHLDDGVRELHALEHDRVALVAQRLSGDDVLETADRDDVSGPRRFNVLARVGVHLQQPPHALLLALVGVEHVGSGLDGARVDAHEGQGPDKLVGHDLESQARKVLVVAGGARHRDVGLVGVGAVDRREVERRREVGDDSIQQGLHALVLEGRAAQHGDKGPCESSFTDQRLERGLV